MKTFIKLPDELNAQIRGRYEKDMLLVPQYYEVHGYLLNADVLENELFKDVWPALADCEQITLRAAEIRELIITTAEEELRARLKEELKEDPEVIAAIKEKLERGFEEKDGATIKEDGKE